MKFDKILSIFLVIGSLSVTLYSNNASAEIMRILGDSSDTLPMELNDNGIVTGRRSITTYSDPYLDWVQGDKGGPVFQVTRYATIKTDIFSTFWSFGTAQFSHSNVIHSKIFINNADIILIDKFPENTKATIVTQDGRAEEIDQVMPREVIALLPDGEIKKINPISNEYSIYYFDDEGNIMFKSDKEKTKFYSQNIDDLEGTTQVDLSFLKDIRDRFKFTKWKNPHSIKKLEKIMDEYFYSAVEIPTDWPYPYPDPESKTSGWKIIDVLFANNKGQLVVKAKYFRKSYSESKSNHLGFPHIGIGSPHYIFIDITQ